MAAQSCLWIVMSSGSRAEKTPMRILKSQFEQAVADS